MKTKISMKPLLLLTPCLFAIACSDRVSSTPWDFQEHESTESNNSSEIHEDDEPSLELSPFVGRWLVSQPYHAGYEATTYDFLDTGELVEVQNFDFGSGPVPVGRVAQCESFGAFCERYGVECVFADRWRSVDLTLHIRSECSDGIFREVELTFQDDLTQPFIEPRVSVEGDETWEHNSFQWAWERCGESCECHLEGGC